ncbi:MAG: DUF983 domain-containing protein [Tunicatimonas sp.]
MARKSAWSAILNHKCPRCREGDIFTYSLLKKPTKFIATNKKCPHCDLVYEREPGFFFGAMYVSYAITMAIFLGFTFILYFFFGDPSLEVYIVAVVGTVIVLTPVVFRFSRTLYLHGFGGVKYNEAYSE